ncbi:hypothetical protein [Curtobacterium luteum]|uniref:Uncharacterized protein n=1 Tax=Curtobacterium luteum TaxID=33881 RepID=A0A175RG78_9MICO|nr:hypothetical protein [Curtobacterium luteum]KTR02847.1 hypothetical protein NS184_15225 [Curtobacterium luteum]
MEFSEVAGELLLVAPGDFVRARTERQRAVRKDDRALATRIGGLRKPAPAAWVVDLLVHDEALDEAIDLGPALREAQAGADPDEIATLRKQRARLVRRLTDRGAALAAGAGHEVTRAVLDQVAATIEAAMMDPHAAAAVRSGLLVRPLESVGFDGVDLDGALADPDAVPDAWSGSDAEPIPIDHAPSRGRRGGRGGQDDDEGSAGEPTRASRPTARKREAEPDTQPDEDAPVPDRGALRRAEADARRASREADAALDAAEETLDAADARQRDLHHRRDALAAELEQLDRDLADLAVETERLGAARDVAEAASDRARAELDAVRARRGGRRA